MIRENRNHVIDLFLEPFADRNFALEKIQEIYISERDNLNHPSAMNVEDWIVEQSPSGRGKKDHHAKRIKPAIREKEEINVTERRLKQQALCDLSRAIDGLDSDIFLEICERYSAITGGLALKWNHLSRIANDLFDEYRGKPGRPEHTCIVRIIETLAVHYELNGKKVTASASVTKSEGPRVHEGYRYSEFVWDLHDILKSLKYKPSLERAALAKKVKAFLSREKTHRKTG